MEITEYVDFIKEQFKEVATANNMIFENRNAGIVTLKNKFIEIYFSTEKYGKDLILTINNDKKREYYTIYSLSMKILGNLNYLSESEIEKSKSYQDNVKSIIYTSSIFIKNHCQDLLNGDFSSVGEGNPL